MKKNLFVLVILLISGLAEASIIKSNNLKSPSHSCDILVLDEVFDSNLYNVLREKGYKPYTKSDPTQYIDFYENENKKINFAEITIFTEQQPNFGNTPHWLESLTRFISFPERVALRIRIDGKHLIAKKGYLMGGVSVITANKVIDIVRNKIPDCTI